MKVYPEYKASGIDWLGEIPSHWRVAPGKWSVNFTYGFPADSRLFSIEKKGLPLIRIRDINSVDTEVYYEGTDYPKEAIIHVGDVLIGMDGDFNIAKWKGQEAILNQRVCKFNGGNGIIKDFIYYLMPLILSDINSTKYATTVKHLSAADLAEMRLPIPSFDEQEKITAYLDNKTAKIDALVAEKQAQVEDLRKYRTSLITETVTRGLNPDTPFRPSYIDGLGDIPEHWNTSKLKYVSEVQTGSTPSTSETKYWEYPNRNWFTPGDFNNFRLYESSRKLSSLAFEETACRIFPKNSVLLVAIGGTLGKVGIVDGECSANQQINAISFNELIYPLFGAYYLSACKSALNQAANASTLPILNQEQTKNFPIVVPPLEEQKEIAEYLDDKTAKIGALIDELNKQLEELALYRKAVISEAVTGKVDVRDWKQED
jgi:type I restriction enzyme S subunit|nr:restriction endonuclease subunit S [Bacteroides intestinalis]